MPRKKRKLDQFLSQRRKSQDLVLAERAQLFTRIFRVLAIAASLVLLAVLTDPRNVTHAIGVAILLLLLTGLEGMCLNRLEPATFDRPGSFARLLFLVLLTYGLYRLVAPWSPFLAPIPMFAMVAALVYSQVTALLVVLMMAFFVGITSPRIDAPQGFLNRIDFPLALVLTIGGVAAILGMKRIRKQSKPAVVGLLAGSLQALTIVALDLMRKDFVPERLSSVRDLLDPMKLRSILNDPGWGCLGGIISGGIVTTLLPAIERFFQIVTDRRLLDLQDPSNDLLKALRERAPGTYQHSLGVAQLARNAAEAIGGDALLAEVGTLYHDIGKIVKPEYFVENMGEDKSIHNRLKPSMSKMIVISHVKDGMDLAREGGLPQKLIDLIPMHHGTTVVEYFYQKARRESVAAEDAPGEVEYRYPGPRPRFREAGILMLADSVEAIAKTEAEPNPSRFRAMVHDQILKRLLDGQLDESDLTLNDLRVIEDSFVRTLTNMYHSRIKYPSDDPGSGSGSGSGRPREGEAQGAVAHSPAQRSGTV
jgi:putative nucleotidyltransferase with HDIG domain